jgi:uncharacterized protein involved in response to NO
LQVSRLIVVSYTLLLASFLVRLGGALPQVNYMTSVVASGVLWIISFGLFSAVYLPILWRPRADGRPG